MTREQAASRYDVDVLSSKVSRSWMSPRSADDVIEGWIWDAASRVLQRPERSLV